MNTTSMQISLNDVEKELLNILYRQSKICDGMQINFLSARLGMPTAAAETVVRSLHTQGLVLYQKYGVLRLTESGKNYLQYRAEAVKLI